MTTVVRQLMESVLYRYGWDTRCRNLAAARLLSALLANLKQQPAPILLDIGCGEYGLKAFLSAVTLIGVDKQHPKFIGGDARFVSADIKSLPFSDQSVSVACCVDVLEHLSIADRERALGELVRVAKWGVLITCPHGDSARSSDEAFQRWCELNGRAVPRWVFEHLEHPYPFSSSISSQVSKAAMHSGRTAKIALSFNEPIKVCRFLRGAAAKSDYLYFAVNLFLGALTALLREPGAGDSYRMVMFVRFGAG